MKKNNLYKKRSKILTCAKSIIKFDGWNDKLILSISDNLKVPSENILILFPKGYLDLLKFYISEEEERFIQSINKLNFNNMRVHEKIIRMIMTSIKNNQNEKELIRKTFNALIRPKNIKYGLNLLYNIVDEIWYFAGDKSTDFNYYTKRIILAKIYSFTLIYWLNNEDKNLSKTKKFLTQSLENTLKIKTIKKDLSKKIQKSYNKFKLAS
tara:strand:- start:2339 stop:2968 length:630 start_codon:yes stop_codon:yes gene_type:complete